MSTTVEGKDIGLEESSPTERLDQYGLPLVPQPVGDSTQDPLNWSGWIKTHILLTVSTLAFLGPFVHSLPNPAYNELAKHFEISLTRASYQTTIAIAAAGFAPFLWVPLSNVYGRRPVLLSTSLIGSLVAVGAGKASTYNGLLAARFFHGFFTSAAMSIGAATVTDLFFLHERGKAMGLFAMFVSNGAHLSPFIGGYMAMGTSYRWCYYLGAIVFGVAFLWMLFTLPETLFNREQKAVESLGPDTTLKQEYISRLKVWGFNKRFKRDLSVNDFFKPLQVIRYPTVTLSAICYAVTFAYASIEPAVTVASIFTARYGFNSGQDGLVLGISLLIGTTLGEVLAGPIADLNLRRARKKSPNGEVEAETRLNGIWPGVILLPIGLLIYGFTIEYHVAWAVPCIGMGLACFGMQIIASVMYIYCSDSYRPLTGHIGQLFNFARQTFGFTLGFYSLPLGHKIGFHLSFVIYTIICLVAIAPILGLMKFGTQIRKRTPTK